MPFMFGRYTYVGNDPINKWDPTGKDGAPPPSFGYALGLEIAVAQGDMTREEASAALNQANQSQTAGVLLAGSFYLPGPEDAVSGVVAASKVGKTLKGVGAKISKWLSSLGKKGAGKSSGISAKISRQMETRGWEKDTLDNPAATRSATNKATGNEATAYFRDDGSYVVKDNVTGDIVQVSNRNDPNWVPDDSIVNPPNFKE